jgi:sulfur carrier protein ThiS
MQVTLRLYSILRHRDGDIIDRIDMDLPENSTISSVLRLLEIPDDLEIVLTINGKVVDVDATLADGDLLSLVPAVAGG